MQKQARQEKYPTIFNLKDKNDKSITALLGFSKYLCGGFNRNNIQMTGNWYLHRIKGQTEEITEILNEFKPSQVNFVGTSKSNTGSFIFASRLAKKFPDIEFRIFAFSAYTILNKIFFVKEGLLNVAPASLVKIWNNDFLCGKAEIHGDALKLLNHPNIKAYLLYPAPSNGGEPIMAKRLEEMSNVITIPLEVRVHGILFPFWKPLLPGLKLELFEGQTMELPEDVYSYFYAMQNDVNYTFNLYSVVYDTENFIEEIDRFNRDWIGTPYH